MIDLPVACSPCPNDLFILHAWVHGKLDSPYRPQIDIADVQTLNEWAVDEKYPLIKVSYGVLSQLKRPENYLILPTGSALGWNSGPLLVANRKIDREDVRHARVAVPGANTTARWLFDFFIQPQQEPIWCSYEEVFPLLLAGEVDAGVLIHETRFEYERYQMQLVADLGAEWERRYELPIPLGGFLLHRSMCDQASALIAALRSSLESAWK
ncbi:MAG: 1,4-dihydroxy-6-naphthoate synthase, partial [Chlamydiia bacterium]|nr:1,4-dihydroxy-6-naphthoate synthase [Chlamydiia bacterium]